MKLSDFYFLLQAAQKELAEVNPEIKLGDKDPEIVVIDGRIIIK